MRIVNYKKTLFRKKKIKRLEEDVKIAEARLLSFEEVKAEKIQLDERLKLAEQEKKFFEKRGCQAKVQ